MFNLDNFKVMLIKNHYTYQKLSKMLNMSISTFYRRLQNGGFFTTEEVRLMIAIFGKKDVFNALFN